MHSSTVIHRHQQQRRRTQRHGGATLVELLVVLVIFALLAASAIPMLAPIMSNRQTREAARIVSAMFTGARNRAMQSGRPYAVVLDRMPGLPEACVSLAYAEVPPPYAGDTFSSVAAVFNNGSNGFITFLGVPSPMSGPTSPDNPGNVASTDIGWLYTVRVGDLIRFNNQGPYYQLVPNTTAVLNNAAQAYYQPPQSTTLNPAPPLGTYTIDPATANFNWQLAAVAGSSSANSPPSGFYRYQIFRAPMRSAAGGVTLPGSTVIDLNFSGFDQPCQQVSSSNTQLFPYGYTYSFQPIWPRPGVTGAAAATCPFGSANASTAQDTSSIVIMFAPSGAIDTVWCWDNTSDAACGTLTIPGNPSISTYSLPIPLKPLTPIHLLIGRRELVPLPTAPATNTNPNDPNFQPYLNWQDLGCLWVSIDHKSGAISTAENSASDTAMQNSTYGNSGYGSYPEIMESRRLAIELQRLGGR
ncbi:MAG TPA: prepilin-type N-terminal cleavage/methylation domain-containing protein [Pirellulales bacterium]|nr:prepilin-type N-terminal cleavage/methylation domain-containing protein [Pirellulales bacterium]